MKPVSNPPMQTQLFINNEWVPAASGKTFATANPATLAELAKVAEGDAADINKARAFNPP